MPRRKTVGTIIGVERKTIQVGKQQLLVEKLNLLTDEGLRSFDLSQVQQIRFLRADLEAELRQALTLLALGHDTEKKTVKLKFVGQGQRKVRVGYIVESPIWKTSYRMVIKDDGSVYLQGWAIVENTSEEDWKDLGLTLVSGRPISFTMDLYSPLYVDRPVVEPELYASLRPQTYGQDLEMAAAEFQQKARLAAAKPAAKAPAEYRARANRQLAQAGAALANGRRDAKSDKAMELDIARSVESVAQASNVGELFRYAIANPVTIPRRQSAMLPIVNETIEGEKVSIYNEGVMAKHPLNGLRIKNTTDLNLMQGPITVFDGGVYAGDAKIEDLSPQTERLLSYALDLDTEVVARQKSSPDQLLKIKFYKGTLLVDHKARRTRSFEVKNSGDKPKKVLLEHTKNSDWALKSPAKASETTRDRYRFAVTAEPGKPAKLEVVEERQYTQSIYVNNLNDKQIRYYIGLAITSGEVKGALEKIIKLKSQLAQITRAKQLRQNEVKTIDQEQGRIRRNMPQLDRTSELYVRYVKKLNDQEDQIEKLRVEIENLIKQETAKRKEIDSFLYNLDLS